MEEFRQYIGLRSKPAQYFDVDGVPFLMGNNVTERGIKCDDTKLIPAGINEMFSQHALREGDVITVRVGAPGLTCVVPKEADGLNCGSLMIVRRSPHFESSWLSSVMNSFIVRTQIAQVQYGAAQEQINITDAVNFLIASSTHQHLPSSMRFADAETQTFRSVVTELPDNLPVDQWREGCSVPQQMFAKQTVYVLQQCRRLVPYAQVPAMAAADFWIGMASDNI
jgi:hypothetical protein